MVLWINSGLSVCNNIDIIIYYYYVRGIEDFKSCSVTAILRKADLLFIAFESVQLEGL